ncbi:tryptophan synthase subunit alpha [Candidatus Roizmanbacteria bacterium]|nr:tryptophan synthase subunit alpha [Candidatus Roizmanbacteria bacterium]
MSASLMTHLYYGDPSEDFSAKLAETLVAGGADMLEIGIPYSDPVCDGEVFQRACMRAISAGMTPHQVLEGVRKLRDKGINNPVYVTCYFGPVYTMGVENFVRSVKEVGAQGIIIPDILLEEQHELLKVANSVGISVTQFATQYSTGKRLEQIISVAKDFIYCVAVPGVTGAREKVEKQTIELIATVKRTVTKSKKNIRVFVGFGISQPDHVRRMISAGANGVIVGSAIGKLYESNFNDPNCSLRNIGKFIKTLKAGTIEEDL